MAAGISLNR